MSGPIIVANELRKEFWVRRHRQGTFGALRSLVDRGGTHVEAVAGVSFTIQPGEVVGYIGPNGAGKSTTIKMLTGILVPSGGEATVDGIVPWRERKRLAQRIGVVFGQRSQLWWDLPLIESLYLLRYIYRVPDARFEQVLGTARATLDLDPFIETPVRQLSLGQRMRGDLAAALLHEPKILYLDEPTIGLDVVAKARIREFLRELNRERGVTILLTTHDLADIESLCSRIVVIDHGRLLYDGGVNALRAQFGTTRHLVVDYHDHVAPLSADRFGPHVQVDTIDGPRLRLAFDRDRVPVTNLIADVASLQPVNDITIEEPAIEDIIRQIYEGTITLSRPDSPPPPA